MEFILSRVDDPVTLSADEMALSATMISYWSRFAKKGNPNSKAQPHWAPYNLAIDDRQSLAPGTGMVAPESNVNTFHNCSSFWDPIEGP